MKNINVRILNASGDETLVQDLTTAIQTIIDTHYKQKQWAYVGSKAFQFTATSAEDPALLADAARLRDILLEAPEGVTVTLAGELVGGVEIPAGLAAAIAQTIADHLPEDEADEAVFEFRRSSLNSPAEMLAETSELLEAAQGEDGPLRVVVTDDAAE